MENLSASTLVDLLEQHAIRQPQKLAFEFLENRNKSLTITYGELAQRARAIAVSLLNDLEPGDRALLLYAPGIDYIAGFFGCLYAGIIAVPAYPPTSTRMIGRLLSIVEDAGTRVALTTSQIMLKIRVVSLGVKEFRGLKWIVTNKVKDKLASRWQQPDITPQTLAFLQYTSGSTSTPKGVMLTHGNLLANLGMIYEAFDCAIESSSVFWLPPYHDMGLIGAILGTASAGHSGTLMSPVSFIKDPISWLEILSDRRATHSGGPNFAYDLCVRKISTREKLDLDLSQWRVAINGAEPIRPETIERFVKTFEPYGFRKDAFLPAYGLAEATLYVSGTQGLRAHTFSGSSINDGKPRSVDGSEDARPLIGCGFGAPGLELAIVDPETTQKLDPGEIGEIWVKGDSVAQGYWGRPALSKECFRARIANSDAGPFLRTGDLGFFHQDELFIAGRIKDLLIIRGRNHYPQDIELTMEQSHSAVREGGCAAFSFERDGEEQLGVACELQKAITNTNDAVLANEVITAVREGITAQHQVEPLVVILLKAGTIPKTSSGKIQRHAVKQGFGRDTLSPIAVFKSAFEPPYRSALEEFEAPSEQTDSTAQSNPVEEVVKGPEQTIRLWLAEAIAQKTQSPQEDIDPHKPVLSYGLDSIAAVELVARLEAWLDIPIDAALVYEHPTIADIAGFLGAQRPDIDDLEAAEAQSDFQKFAITASNLSDRYEPFPLTDVQQAYIVGRDKSFELGGIGTAGWVMLETDLDIPRLSRAWNELIRRHGMLRAVFTPDGRQKILPEVPEYKIELEHLMELEADACEQRLEEEKRRLSTHVFSPSAWPLFELKAFETRSRGSVLAISLDMLVVDGFSLSILEQELLAAYHQPENTLPEIGINFRDYVLRLQDLKKSERYKQAKDYWLSRLQDLPDAPRLPVVTPPAQESEPFFARCAKTLSTEETGALELICRSEGLQLPAMLATVYASILSIWSNQKQLTLNFTVFNRYPLHPDVLRLVGDFTSILLIDVDFSDGKTKDFIALVKQTQATIGNALRHRHYDGVELIKELSIAKGRQGQALMPVVFTSMLYGNLTGSSQESAETIGRVFSGQSRTPQVMLDHQVSINDGALQITWDYPVDLFDKRMVEEMFAQYTELLSAIAEGDLQLDPELPLRHRQLLEVYNSTAQPIPEETLDSLFSKAVEQHPTAIAIEHEGGELTYRELDRLSNQIAYALVEKCVGRGDFVAVLGETVPMTIANILAVNKIGAAYVPVDPTYPEERKNYIIENSDCVIELHSRFYHNAGCESLPTSAPPKSHEPSDIAYIIYTSGSTGRPKGVVISHRAAANTVQDINARYQVNQSDRLLLISSLGFDLSVYDVFGALAAGATLVLAPFGKDLAALAQTVKNKAITIWNSVPAILDLTLDAAGPDYRCDSLRVALLSGDWIPLHLFDKARRACPRMWFNSLGGATEGSIWSIHFPVTTIDPTWKSIPYGYPLANQAFYVLDFDMRPCPIGVPGELCIGGKGVATEYKNNPEETARSFIQHPTLGFLYRTGDMGVFREEGYIEFLGREDHQVKIRGYRIELGEIETRLLEHPSVNSAVVVDRDDPSGTKYLAAYVVSSGPIDESELRTFLAKTLPDYMIPSFFSHIDGLPLSSNGKVDRKALPNPSVTPVEEPVTESIPITFEHVDSTSNPIQEKLVEIWKRVIGVDTVGAGDNFFQLGGDSLMAQQIINEVRNTYNLTIPIGELFRRQTIAEICEYVEQQRPELAATLRARPTAPHGEKKLLDPLELFGTGKDLYSEEFPEQIILGSEKYAAFKKQALQRTYKSTSGIVIELDRDHRWSEEIENRRTIREFDESTPIGFDTFSRMLTVLRQRRRGKSVTYYYGSAGGLYPIDVFIWFKPGRVEDIDPGLYYYNPVLHSLELVNAEAVITQRAHYSQNRDIFDSSAFSLFLIYDAKANMPIYNSSGHLFACIETGMMTQLVSQAAESLGLGVCPIGELDFSSIRKQFHLEDHHVLIHSLECGLKPSEARSLQSPLSQEALSREVDVPRLAVSDVSDTATETAQHIPLVDRDKPLPLSTNQRRLWFLEQYDSASAAYNMPAAVELVGPLDAQRLRQSFEALLQRHEVLRTRFVSENGVPQQVIDPSGSWSLPLVDLTELSETEATRRGMEMIVQNNAEPFDLRVAPLWRTTLYLVAQQKYILGISMHHIISDGWSAAVLMQDIHAIYSGLATGNAPLLPALPVQYADFAAWQESTLSDDRLRDRLEHWKNALADLPVLEVPSDRPRPAQFKYQGYVHQFEIPASVVAGLRALCQERHATLFMGLLGAFQVLLGRLAGSRDVPIGTPIAGRQYAELEPLIGFFANTLVIRTRFEDNPPFSTLLTRVRQTVFEALEHQEVPFDKIVDSLGVERDPSRTPLFQHMFALQPSPYSEVAFSDLTMSRLAVNSTAAKFDLSVVLYERNTAILGQVEYSAALYDEPTIARMFGSFVQMLELILENPDGRVLEYPLLSNSERHRILESGTDTPEDAPCDLLLHELVSQHAERTPLDIAAQDEHTSLTYRELDERANQIAQVLQGLDVGPEVIVGLSLPKTVDIVVGIIGILKAGGAYLPLDPSYPAARLSFMLEDSKTHILVTHSAVQQVLPLNDLKVVYLDDPSVCSAPLAPVATSVCPDNLAYVIYTSGSTGKPKGTALHHRGLSNLVSSLASADWVHKNSRFLQFSALSFDASVAEIAPTLGAGATLVIPSRETMLSPDKLTGFIKDKKVEAAIIPPAVLRLFEDDALPLQTLIVAGEKCSAELAKRWAPGRTFINGYGPTENTVCSTQHVYREDLDDAPPIGKPISNVSCYVLDEALEPVPVGATGELFVGGLNVARGYLKHPKETALAFLPDPFSKAPGSRIYRTGDLVRRQADGTLVFLERRDDQVKIRGFRIELGEIESHLSNIEGISNAAVIPDKALEGDTRLIAYAATKGAKMSPDALRSRLLAQLPDYMVPTAFVFLDSLPLSPSGKVDRKALPAPDAKAFKASQDMRFPTTPTQIAVYDIWRDLLGLDQFSIDDDFFVLGGHSLLATQVISRLIKRFEVDVPVRALFDAATVAKLAARVDELLDGDYRAEAIPPIDRSTELAPSLAQERLWFLSQLEPNTSNYNISGAFRLEGELDADVFDRSIDSLFDRHELLGASFVNKAGRPQVIPNKNTKPQLERREIPKDNDDGEAAALRRFLDDFYSRTFALDKPPLVRFALVRLARNEHVVALNMHHIISDGWSVFVLMNDFIQTYNSLTQGAGSDLPELKVQYLDYAAWQRTYLVGQRLEALSNYWSEKLKGSPSLIELPTDRPRPPVQTFTGSFVEKRLDTDLCHKLEKLGNQNSSTLFMTLLTGFYALMHRLGGQEDIVVGTPIAGRNRSELENLVGFFLNLVPLRVQLDAGSTFEELLETTRETTLDAYAHQDLPFEQIIDKVKPERSLAYTPLFQVFFNMLEFPFEKRELAGITIDPLDIPDLGSKFDITSYVTPEDNGGITLRWVYNADLFDEQRVNVMLEQYELLLRGAVSHPEAPIGAHQLLTKSDAVRLPDPTAHLDDTWHGPIHAAVTTHAAENPNRIAVEDPSGCATYDELEVLSNRLARRLMELGVQKGDPVAIFAHRSCALVRGILGVLKAGGAFLILDPAYPDSRLRKYLEIAKPKALLCLQQAGPLPNELGAFVRDRELPIIELLPLEKKDPEDLRRQNSTPPGIDVGPDDIAVVTFTSGSTGRPKAVLGRHGPLTHFLPWQTAEFKLSSKDRFSLLSGLAHDPLQRDIFTALWCGGALSVPLQEEILEPGWLAGWMDERDITVAHLTPAMAQILNTGDAPGFPSLRLALTVGDRLLKQDVHKLFERAPGVTVVNMYGSTETQRAVGYHIVKDPSSLEQEVVPMGQGMPDAQLLIVNEHKKLCAAGEIGEIWVRSPHLAAGYLDDETLTNTSFVTNPFTSDANDRVYRTGDLGRYRPDGVVDFAGRADDQIKIRGFRVELGEIEAVLRDGAEIQECAVVLHGEGSAARIVAYVVSKGDELDSDVLSSRVKERLPDYMRPAAYVPLERIPMTPNGKLDKKALPAPDLGDIQTQTAPPRTQTEEILCSLVGQLLDLDVVGITDNFFDLGGHSLLATQAISRIRDAFGVDLPLRALFEGPTVAELAQSVDGLLTEGSTAGRIVPVPRRDQMPLSLAQERLWFLDEFESQTSTYNMFGAFRLKGGLDLDLVERCVFELFHRHELLKAFFISSGGVPALAFDNAVSPSIERRDILTTDDKADEELDAFIAEFSSRPFDLGRPPLIRVALVRRSDEDHVVAVNMHHIISDGWSIAILMRDLVALYNTTKCDEPALLPELPVQYADYAAWQRTFLVGQRLEALSDYWSQKLKGSPPLLELPTDRPRPAVQTFTGRTSQKRLDRALGQKLEEIGQKSSSTLFMTLLSGFYGLMHRLSGQNDIVLGTPIAGRNRSELENLVGFFLNLLPLRVHIDAATTFEQLLRATRESTLGAYAHQDLPFEQIIEELRPQRSLAYTPVFQVFFNMLEFPFEKKQLAGLTIEPMEMPDLGSKFDITSYVIPEDDGGITLRWVYNADLFDDRRIEGMLDQYELLLLKAVELPEAPIASHELLTSPDVKRLPNPTVRLDDTWHGPIHAAVTAHAAENPNRIAVEDLSGCATYGELETLSNRLARRLMDLGVRKGNPIAVFAHRSCALVRGILGVLKAGGAFLILDPAYPGSRLRKYLEIAKPKALLCLQEAGPLPDELGSLVRDHELPIIELPPLGEQDPEDLARQDSTPPGVDVGPDDIAVVTFTSGSTGQPKAVLGRHGPLTHFLPWQIGEFELSSKDRFSLLSGLGHDPLQRDIFTALWCGGTIVSPPQEKILEPGWLAGWMDERDITVAHLTPAMAQVLNTGDATGFPSLRLALTVGDRLLKRDVHKLFERAPGVTVVNMYGSTETQRAVGYHIVKDPSSLEQEVVPMGQGMPDAQLLIVNEHKKLCAAGEIGEIWVRSPHLAAGYLGDETLTKKRFTINPFTGEPNDRIYKTGDLGRYRPNGVVEFAGRADDQVKIRGFRVELGEIEAVLRDGAEVQECAAALHGEGPAARIVAYVVSKGDELDVESLKQRIKERLPNYMRPAVYVPIDRIPLTANGKLDKKALPAPDLEDLHAEAAPPRTQIEEVLCSILGQLLGLDAVGITDNFFDLGGHSLLATQAVSRIRDAFGVDLPLRALFEGPTVAELAQSVDGLLTKGRSAELIASVPRQEKMPLSLAQERLWFLDAFETKASTYNMFGAFRLKGALDTNLIEGCIEKLFERHELLKAFFTSAGGIPSISFDKNAEPVIYRVEIPIISDESGEALRSFIALFASRAFELSQPPLMRVALVRRSDKEHVVALTMHHIISDGWSMAILMRDLVEIYNATKCDDPIFLPELPVQYADYAAWQRGHLAGERLEALSQYWSQKLKDSPPLLELPTERPRPAVQTFTGRTAQKRLDRALCQKLEEIGQKSSSTLFMTLLSGFYGLMHRLSGQNDIVLGTPVAGRNRSELENLVGFFLNLLPLRVQLDSDTSFEELLQATRETTLDAYANQDLPFEQIIDKAKPERSLAYTPLFQVFFNMLEFPFEKKQLPGLTIEPIETPDVGAKFDITSYVVPEDGGSITLRWVYNADLFDDERVAQMLDQYELLLRATASHPEAPIASHELLTSRDILQLPDPTTHLDDTWHGPIQAALTSHAAKHPTRLAVEDLEGCATYGELEVFSNRLAHRLIELGVQKGDPVAVFAHRSCALVRAILGVLKAGGAFLVLDPAYPESRLRTYLEIAQPKAVVCLQQAGPLPDEPAAFARHHGLPLVELPPLGEKEREDLTRQEFSPPSIEIGPNDIAVLTFTSGSTGQPKAVLGRHGPLTHFLPWQTQRFGLTANDRFSLLSGLAHDPLQRDIFTALWCGGAIVAPPQEEILEPGRLSEWMRENSITVCHLTPAMAQLLLTKTQEGPASKIPSLRLALTVGDRLLKRDVLKLTEEAPRVTVVNMYGSTETQRAVGHFVVTDPSAIEQEVVPVGQGIPDVQLLIVSEQRQLCAPGEIGEIWVRSPHLAAGYLGDQALTEKRFTRNPLTDDPDDRIYRTGDLGRYRLGGIVEFAGRADDQVKIRGFRVELGEIEAILLGDADVQECAVVLDEKDAAARIVAYVVPRSDDLDLDSLGRRIGKDLPSYMRPASYVLLERIPLTPNGKLDKRALPQPNIQDFGTIYVEPQNPTEQVIADICREVLKIERIGVFDNFFDLGGHSLLAAQVVARVQEAFEVKIRIIDLFESPTIAGLAEIVDALLIVVETDDSFEDASNNEDDYEEGEL